MSYTSTNKANRKLSEVLFPIGSNVCPRVNALLENNRILRSVSLRILPKLAFGAAVIVSECSEGSEKLIESYSAFSAGPQKMIEIFSLLNEKYTENMLEAVVDRPSKNSLRAGNSKFNGAEIKFDVACGRQAFIPLKDGSFLGIKGCGQFIKPNEAAFILNSNPAGKMKWFGFVRGHEITRIEESKELIAKAGAQESFSKLLGYRKIKLLPDLEGNCSIDTSDLSLEDKGRPASPHLVFYKTFSPLRLSKLPQILEDDPTLARTLRNLSPQARQALGIPNGSELTIDSWLSGLAVQFGRSEAFKSFHSVDKVTLHLQDINFAGQENDLEEIKAAESKLSEPTRGFRIKNEMLKDILDCLVAHGLANKVRKIEFYSTLLRTNYFSNLTDPAT